MSDFPKSDTRHPPRETILNRTGREPSDAALSQSPISRAIPTKKGMKSPRIRVTFTFNQIPAGYAPKPIPAQTESGHEGASSFRIFQIVLRDRQPLLQRQHPFTVKHLGS